jgi:hypothetical protein
MATIKQNWMVWHPNWSAQPCIDLVVYLLLEVPLVLNHLCSTNACVKKFIWCQHNCLDVVANGVWDTSTLSKVLTWVDDISYTSLWPSNDHVYLDESLFKSRFHECAWCNTYELHMRSHIKVRYCTFYNREDQKKNYIYLDHEQCCHSKKFHWSFHW